MSSLSANINPPMPPVPTGAVVVPGASTNAPVAPAVAGGGGAPADQAQVVAMLQALVAILTQLAARQGAQAGAAGVQGGGGGVTFPPTTMGGFVAGGPTFDPVVMGNSSSFGASSATTASSPFGAGVVTTSGSFGASFAPTSDTGTTATTNAATTTPVAPGATGGGATAAPAVIPVIDMRRVLGNPQPGDVIDTIINAATLTAQPSKSEGQYILIQDANGAQLQAHVHGAWSSHPARIKEGIARGFIQVHLHEDGTLHLHDVM